MSFTVFINTASAVDTTVDDAFKDYNIDWSRFEEGDYEMSFSFETDIQTRDETNDALIPQGLSLPDLPLKNVISPFGGRSQSSSCVGLLRYKWLEPIPFISDIVYPGPSRPFFF